MNEVTLTGYLRTVSATTNGEIKVEDTVEWRHGFGASETTFYTDDKSWVKVEIDEQLCDYLFTTNRMMKHLKIGGELKTKVSFGTGIVTNYIKVTRVEVLQEEEND